MVWGLEDFWASGSTPAPQQTSAPPSNPSSGNSVPLVNISTPANGAATPSQVPATATTLPPAMMKRIEEGEHAHNMFSPRSRKQFTLFAAGATFMLLSARFTRRQLRNRLPKKPPPFKANNAETEMTFNGPMEAVEALSIATVNVLSFTMMMTGGLLWAFDISSVDDLRRKIRGGLGVDGSGRDEKDVEEEFEEWLATVLDRKERKQDALAERLRKEGRLGGAAGGIGDMEEVRETWRNERGKPRNI